MLDGSLLKPFGENWCHACDIFFGVDRERLVFRLSQCTFAGAVCAFGACMG